MKIISPFLGFLFLILTSLSCSQSKPFVLESFIEEYSKEDFSYFKGINIFHRSGGRGEVIYGIYDNTVENMPLYFVTFNQSKQVVTKVNQDLVKKTGFPDYLTKEKIEDYIVAFRKYKFYYLSVDKDNNVFINPIKPNAPALLLRLGYDSEEMTIRKGYLFDHYKGRWYVNSLGNQ